MIAFAGEQQVTGVRVGVSVSWDDRARGMLRMEFQSGWTIRDLDAVGQPMATMITEFGGVVGVIIDMTNSPTLPDRLIDYLCSVATFRSRSTLLDRIAHFAVLNCGQFGKVLFQSFVKVNPSNKLTGKVTFVSSLAEAHQVLSRKLGVYN